MHPYFSQRALKPYREEEGLYYFKVQDTLFGLPVVTLFVPGTWDYHGVVFDVPLATARKVMRQRFGSTFAESRRSRDGEAPMLVAYKDNPTRQSVLASGESQGQAISEAPRLTLRRLITGAPRGRITP
jgi:hypothetical protein